MNIIILVIATSNDFDKNLLKSTKDTWVSYFKDSYYKLYYLIGNSKNVIVEDILYSDIKEDVMTVGFKTIDAFQRINNENYDYVIRTNLSSYLNVHKLVQFLMDKPRNSFWSGLGDVNFSSGACYILSKDIVQLILKYKNLWDHLKIDDVALSHMLHYNFKYNNYHRIKRIDIDYKIETSVTVSDVFHYRFCMKDPYRVIDSMNMYKIHEEIINENIIHK